MNQLYYESLERQQLEVRKLRHDMTNHLQTLAGLSGEEHKAYLDKLLDRPGIKRNVQYCENPVINAVLSTKTGKMELEQIAFAYDLQVPSKLTWIRWISRCCLQTVLTMRSRRVKNCPGKKEKFLCRPRMRRIVCDEDRKHCKK